MEQEINFGLDNAGSFAYENFSDEYNHSVFSDFDSFLRTKRIDENDTE